LSIAAITVGSASGNCTGRQRTAVVVAIDNARTCLLCSPHLGHSPTLLQDSASPAGALHLHRATTLATVSTMLQQQGITATVFQELHRTKQSTVARRHTPDTALASCGEGLTVTCCHAARLVVAVDISVGARVRSTTATAIATANHAITMATSVGI
jgi:hypothetical protein